MPVHALLAVLVLALALALAPLPAYPQLAASEAYTPTLSPCPPGTALVREVGNDASQALSPAERAYIAARQSRVLPAAWSTYLDNVVASLSPRNATPLPPYVSDILRGANQAAAYPTFGIATSGGGYRAAIVGAGVLNALDGRNASSVAAGTGGLLQSASYLAGLSGGSWLVTSLAQADFPTIPDLIFGSPDAAAFRGWLAQYSLIDPSADPITSLAYFTDVLAEVSGKANSGFPTSFVDVWARVLSRHFVNGTSAANFFDPFSTHGAGITFSSIANLSTFASYQQPFPIITGDTLSPYQNTSSYYDGEDVYVPLTNPIYEFNVYEMGSFDPTLSAFTPMQYLGSPNSSLCATGLDQASFLAAISSSIFNTLLQDVLPTGDPAVAALLALLGTATQNGTRLAPADDARVPNPFFGLPNAAYVDRNASVLTLVDGGEDGLGIPLMPLLAKARALDVVLAIDVDADTADNWADGSSLVATQQRAALYPAVYAFPPVPASPAAFLAQNLTTRPAFFGCASPSSSSSSSAESPAPLLVYLANGGPPLGQPPATNTSSAQVQYGAAQAGAMLAQAFGLATQGIAVDGGDGGDDGDGALAQDPEWPACLACAVVDRARGRAGVERSGVCATCLERYCWS